MAGPEARIEQAACARILRTLGVTNFKLGIGGWPDRVFLVPGGKPVFIEFKSLSGKPDPRQEHQIEVLKTLGYNVEVCNDVDSAFYAVARALGATRVYKKSR